METDGQTEAWESEAPEADEVVEPSEGAEGIARCKGQDKAKKDKGK